MLPKASPKEKVTPLLFIFFLNSLSFNNRQEYLTPCREFNTNSLRCLLLLCHLNVTCRLTSSAGLSTEFSKLSSCRNNTYWCSVSLKCIVVLKMCSSLRSALGSLSNPSQFWLLLTSCWSPRLKCSSKLVEWPQQRGIQAVPGGSRTMVSSWNKCLEMVFGWV